MMVNNGLLVIIGILALATVLSVATIARAPRSTAARLSDATGSASARSEKTGFGVRAALILSVGLLVGVALVWLGISVPSLLGVPAALSAGLAVSAGIGISAVLKRPSSFAGTITEASLEPRHWWTFARPRSVTLLGVLSALVVLSLVAYVAIGITVPALAPTPAALWVYPAAITGMVCVLVGATYWALRVSADRPLNTRSGSPARDLVLRSVSARIVSGLVGATLFGYLAAIVSTIGTALATLGEIGTMDGTPLAALYGAGVAVQVVSAGLVACSISSLAAATSVAVSVVATRAPRSLPTVDQVAR